MDGYTRSSGPSRRASAALSPYAPYPHARNLNDNRARRTLLIGVVMSIFRFARARGPFTVGLGRGPWTPTQLHQSLWRRQVTTAGHILYTGKLARPRTLNDTVYPATHVPRASLWRGITNTDHLSLAEATSRTTLHPRRKSYYCSTRLETHQAGISNTKPMDWYHGASREIGYPWVYPEFTP